MPRRTFLALLLLFCVPLAAMMSGCNQKETAMRDEIIAYEKSIRGHSGQVDVTHLVEKYIKIGDSMETAKEILLKNGFSVMEAKHHRRYRIQAGYKIRGDLFYREDIAIFLGRSPESKIVDFVLAKVNYQP